MKISFKNDYAEGCHPNILSALVQSNLSQEESYGADSFCQQATAIIRKKLAAPTSEIYYVSGGTQANLIIATALLRPHESIISANTGHIFTNEAGAIEASGHKIHSVPSESGKLTADGIVDILDQHQRAPHQLKPRLVYISNATELGTTYTYQELNDIHQCCQQHNLLLFLDGARLGQAIAATNNDLNWQQIAAFTDVFYIGGTKNGALIGEAIVINNPTLQTDFAFIVKQKGALLSKSRLLGIQFYELFREDLYEQLAKHANAQAMKLKNAFHENGCNFLTDTFTNMIFPILRNEQIEILRSQFEFYEWKKITQEQSAIRIITSWATPDSHIDKFIESIKKI